MAGCAWPAHLQPPIRDANSCHGLRRLSPIRRTSRSNRHDPSQDDRAESGACCPWPCPRTLPQSRNLDRRIPGSPLIIRVQKCDLGALRPSQTGFLAPEEPGFSRKTWRIRGLPEYLAATTSPVSSPEPSSTIRALQFPQVCVNARSHGAADEMAWAVRRE